MDLKKLFRQSLLAMTASAFTLMIPTLSWAAGHDIIILHTNDIHCGVKDNLTFSGIAKLKKEKQAQTPYVALVDAGDAVQGAPIGKLSNGESVVNIMNEVGYDFIIPGNHEFDYGMEQFLKLNKLQNTGYYSANFIDLRTGESVLPMYKIMQFDDTKVAFIGVCTPTTLSSSTPIFFQDGKGNFIYSFFEDETGNRLYKRLQTVIDAVRAKGADYVFLVGHLGVNGSKPVWSSIAIAKNTRNVDGIIDGHSHEEITDLRVKNLDGKEVVIEQTGTKIKTVGQITIQTDGTIEDDLITNVDGHDAAIDQVVDAEMAKFDAILNQPLGEAKVQLVSYDPATGERIARSEECNLGDFVTDALRVVLGTDVAILNGGAVRHDMPLGAITYNSLLETFPFSNMAAVVALRGADLADVLEVGAMNYPEENGAFMQVSGMKYTIHKDIPSTVKLNEKGEFVEVTGARRVSDILIDGKPLEPNKKYTVAGITYILKDKGNGLVMFDKGDLINDGELSDIDVIIEYLQNHLNASISGSQYANPHGDGRITIQ